MQAKEEQIFDFLNSVKKITVEKNHRDFCFNVADVTKIYDTIQNTNFLGVFTLKATHKENEYVLIDGYSRFLIFSLLICALINNNIDYDNFVLQLKQKIPKTLKIEFLNNDNVFYKAISTNYFDKDDKYPQILSDVYNFLLQKTALSSKEQKKLIKNILSTRAIFFISDKNDKISYSDLYQGLNSKAVKLSEYDLIKNYVYLICQKYDLKYIFNNYFLQIEKEYSDLDIQHSVIDFIKDYLTIQNEGKIPEENNIYVNFRKFIARNLKLQNLDVIFQDLYRYSKYYAQIITENISDIEILYQIHTINSEKAYDSYPYLMEVFEDWDNNRITKVMMTDILKMVNLLIEQRKSPNVSNFVMTFAKLSTQINKMLALKDYTPRIVEDIPLTINKIIDNSIS